MFMTNIARISKALRAYAASVSLRQAAFIVVGTAISSFGVYNIHQQSGITEGGVIGLILLANRWLGLSPSIATPVLDAACYLFAFRFLGGRFLCLSVASTASLTVLFRIWEQFPPLLPNLSGSPLIAALLGGLFVGTGVGFVIRGGGSCGGDDALALTIAHLTKWRIARAYLLLALTIAHLTKWRIARAYLLTDITVLVLSLSYIPVSRIVFSLVTVTVSSFLIDFIQSRGACREGAEA